MADVQFENFSVQVKNALEDAVIAYLHEAAGVLESATIRNSSLEKYKGIQARELWSHEVDEGDKTATVGSQHEAAYWEEFGTGEHALYGNGRKGWWVYVKGSDTPRSKQNYYTQDEAEAMAASMRAAGLDAYATNGRQPNRPLHNAFETKRSALIQRAEEVLKERLD